ncbi:hypothetical protein J7J69_06960 [candidate division WOR-3 bacterium]|nr:hypothetical protein [candidate division WOR-3 bacterium]
MVTALLFYILGLSINDAQGFFPEKIYIADLEPEGFYRGNILFQIKGQESATSQYQVKYLLFYGKNILAEGRSDIFTLTSGESFQFTSKELGDPSSRFCIVDYNLHTENKQVIGSFLASGVLLPGDYLFEVQFIKMPDGLEDTTVVFEFSIMGGDEVEALAPGVPCGESSPIVVDRPLFLWLGDCDSFTLNIGLMLNSKISPLQNLHLYPVLKKSGLNGNSFQFPHDYPPLEKGEYVWQVVGFRTTSSGVEKISSTPLCFMVEPERIQEIIEILKEKLGEDNPEIVEIEKGGFSPTGTILLNGRVITIEEFREIMAGSKEVKRVRWK